MKILNFTGFIAFCFQKPVNTKQISICCGQYRLLDQNSLGIKD